jgi:hypothetical protein
MKPKMSDVRYTLSETRQLLEERVGGTDMMALDAYLTRRGMVFEYHKGKTKNVTKVMIRRKDSDRFIAAGAAICSPDDKFSLADGIKVALQRAVANLIRKAPVENAIKTFTASAFSDESPNRKVVDKWLADTYSIETIPHTLRTALSVARSAGGVIEDGKLVTLPSAFGFAVSTMILDAKEAL